MAKIGTRLQRFLFETERQIPQATGELSALLSQLEFAGKRISRILSSAGLTDVLGASGAVNVQGEQQQKLDALANEVFLEAFAYGQLVPTDVNANVGSIFSVRRLSGRGAITTEADLLSRISLEQVVAGYFLYGPSTTLVYTEGRTVHGFTLDPVIGEFLLSPPRSAFPTTGRTMARTRAPSSTGSVAHACSSSGCARTIPRQGVPTRRATPARSSRTSTASSSKAGSISTRPRER